MASNLTRHRATWPGSTTPSLGEIERFSPRMSVASSMYQLNLSLSGELLFMARILVRTLPP